MIVSHELLRESGAVQGQRESGRPASDDPVRWIRYEVARSDTNGDGVIDRDDVRQVAVFGPDGRDLAIVLESVDQLLGYAAPEPGELVVFFRRGDGEFVGEISLTARKLTRTTPLPKS